MSIADGLDLQIGSIKFVVERPPNQEWHLDDHVNRFHYILAYAKRGSAHYNFGDDNFHVKKGNVILVKQNQKYNAKSDFENPWHFNSVAFVLEFADEQSRSFVEKLPNVFLSSDSSRMAENFAELYRSWSAKDVGYLIKCRSLILDILYILFSDEIRRQKSSAHYTKIERLIDMIRENCEKSYSIDELCAMSGLSSSHFRMLFKEITGVSAVQFQNKLKIDRAKDLIISRNCNVTEAAHAVGFNDVYYFSRMFRKITGKNPSEYMYL